MCYQLIHLYHSLIFLGIFTETLPRALSNSHLYFILNLLFWLSKSLLYPAQYRILCISAIISGYISTFKLDNTFLPNRVKEYPKLTRPDGKTSFLIIPCRIKYLHVSIFWNCRCYRTQKQ